ncbi:MAG: purine-nucleoside phosphorylase, partial [Patescibacteria group bacterium]|nr:purine-nucleoside phosphorylase [Patescibacteria group bacterium]
MLDIKVKAKTGLILGSGWNRVIDRVKVIKWWDYSDIFSVKSTVPGHQGKLIYGTLAKKPVLI